MARYLYSYKLAHVDDNKRKGLNTEIFYESDFEFTDFDEVCDVARNIVEDETDPIEAFIYQYENKRGISYLDPFATWCVWSIANTHSADANEYVIDENSEVKPTNESRRPRGRMLGESVEDDERVGHQNFTVGEFKRAWKQLKNKVCNDPEYSSVLSHDYSIYVYDKEGNQVYDEIQCYGYSDALNTLSKFKVDEFLIEVYIYKEDGECVSFEHGIDIRNGKISSIY